LKNTSLPRLLTSATLSAAFAVLPLFNVQAQVSQQSYLRNTPNEVEKQDSRIQTIIDRAEKHFKQGELNLKDGKPEQARDEFDKAVDAVLESGLDVRGFPKLQQYYLQLVERVYRMEVSPQRTVVASAEGQQPAAVGAQEQAVQFTQVGFVQQKFEPSPLDELSKLVLTEKEKEVSPDQVAEIEQQIKSTLDFGFKPNPLIQQFLNYYQGRGRSTMEVGLRRSGQYIPMAREIFRQEGVPEDIAWLGQVESAWRPKAQSWAAASGLWQFIPSTGARFGLRQTAWVDERNSFEKATRASARYLKWLYNRYHNWELAIGAYNTGEGNVDRAIRRAGVADFWAIYPYIAQETRNYVPNILAVILVAKSPERYGFGNVQRMPRIDKQYDTINVPPGTSLHLLAGLTDSHIDTLRSINPELRRDTSPGNEAYHVRVPAGKGRVAVELLKRMPAGRLDQVARVIRVSPGEDWQDIANRTGVSVAQLQQWNSGVKLDKGGALVVPRGSVVTTGKTYERPRGTSVGASLKTVTAKGGETLAQLAAQHNASVEEVAKLNGMAADTQLQRGQRVNVPTSGATAPAANAAPRRRR
jgi:membrane-bound lytic murein transglycosylase D